MKKANSMNSPFLYLTIGAILVLNLANLYLSFNLYEKINSIVANEKNFAETTTTTVKLQQQPSQEQTRIQVGTDDDPVKGSKDAKVTMVEFSDFQCPFCARFFQQTCHR